MKESERRELFARARGAASPSMADKRRVRASLSRALGATAVTSVSALASKAAASLAGTAAAVVRASTTVLGKVTLGILAASTVATVAVHIPQSSSYDVPRVVESAPTSRLAPTNAVASSTGVAEVEATRPDDAPHVEPLPPREQPRTARIPTLAAVTAPTVTARSAPAARVSMPAAGVAPRDPPAVPSAEAAPSPLPETPSPPASAPNRPSTAGTAAEIELMAKIQSALRDGATDEVLSLVGEHERRYPSSAWAEDREGARVLALCAHASPLEAAATGQRFLASHGLSTLGARVRATCQLDTSTR